jgi:hypothetical protein
MRPWDDVALFVIATTFRGTVKQEHMCDDLQPYGDMSLTALAGFSFGVRASTTFRLRDRSQRIKHEDVICEGAGEA